MSVLFVLPDLDLGGAQRVFVQVANGLASRGVSTTLYVFSGRGPLRAEISPDVRTIVYSERSLSLGLQLGAAARLRKLLATESWDAVVSTLYQTNMLVSAVHLVAASRSRLILREAIFVSKEWPRSRFYPIARVIGPFLYRRAHKVVVLADEQRTDLVDRLGIDPDRIVRIGNPVIGPWVDKLRDEPLPEEIESQLRTPTILAIGRLDLQKGFDILLRAFAMFRQQREGHLLILGEGAMRHDLERLIATLRLDGSVTMPGTDPNPYKYLRKADLFVLSSRYEGLPNVLIQALAMGVRCVSTDCPSGPRDVLEDGALGLLVPVGDESALAGAMSAALDCPAVAPSPEWITRYDEATVVEQYREAIYGPEVRPCAA